MNLLKYFFYNQVTITSDKSPDEVVSLLKEYMEDKTSFFEGYITNYNFNMHRKHGKYERNSFVPILKGRILQDYDRTKICIVVHLHYLVAIFMVMWTIGILMGVYNGFVVHHNFFSILFVGILCFAWLICWQVYDGEITQAINSLKKLLA